MSYKVMFVLNALVALGLGAAFLFVPMTLLNIFGTEQYVIAKTLGQFFGTAMIALGLLLWFTKDAEDEKIQKGMAYAMFISALLGLIVNIIAVAVDGVIRNYGWITILVYVLFALGYAFMLFMKPKMKE